MFSMMSSEFLGLVAVAVFLLGVLHGRSRQVAFIAVNLVFLVGLLLGVGGTAIVLAFLAIGWLLLRAVQGDGRWAYVAGLPALVALFAYMQDYKLLHLILPESVLTSALATVGLSFLFFKIVHLLIEARSGTLGPIDFLSYVGYCTNFTAFAMGPLQRYPDYREQWLAPPASLPFEHYLDAVIRILVGLVKAYVLAEAAKGFLLTYGASELPLLRIAIGIYAFNVYLYLNFAGYTDVMIGVGTLFGVRPPENFDKPFLARNPSDFWQRQHRSLTTWLTDYVYNPTFKKLLSTQRFRKRALFATNLSFGLTMLVSGLWHGTTWGFLLFGLMHGAYLIVYHSWDAALKRTLGKAQVRSLRSRIWARALAIFITFNAVSLSFVPFQLGASETLAIFGRFLREIMEALARV